MATPIYIPTKSVGDSLFSTPILAFIVCRLFDDAILTGVRWDLILVMIWMSLKEESEKVGLKLNIQKTKTMASGPITSWEIDGETVETVSDFIFGGLQNHCRWWN